MNRKKTELIIIHCAATTPSMDIDADWITKVHLQRGFRTIGYHFFINRGGIIEIGRECNEIGAHAYGKNSVSLGVCLAGGIAEGSHEPEDNFTEQQYWALKNLVNELVEKYPDADVIGHNEVSDKACPSFDVKIWREKNVTKYNAA